MEHVYEVSEVNQMVKNILDGIPALGNICIRGEISNYKVYPSGHCYFTLKDTAGAIRCVLFARNATCLRFRPENGQSVLAFGRVTLYPRDGAYQLYCEALRPAGIGDLHLAFEQLKEKLYAEGLFDAEHKKPLPPFPQKIAIITSPAGAAVHDMCRILRRRYPLADVLLLPVRVQGPEAPLEIAGAVDYANRFRVGDVLIVGRGGGSLEDLWAFNDERVARAIYRSTIPVISAVGHEPDVTISDFVADVRAATPTHAAEIAVPDRQELLRQLQEWNARLVRLEDQKLALLRRRLADLAGHRVLTDPMAAVEEKQIRLDQARRALFYAFGTRMAGPRQSLAALAAKMDALSPLKILGRGFALVTDKEGHILRRAEDAPVGSEITAALAEGKLLCQVTHRIGENT